MDDNRYQCFDYADKKIIIDLKNKTCAGIDKKRFNDSILRESDNALKKVLNNKVDYEENCINTVYLLITRKCNLNCSFCCVRADVKKNNRASEVSIHKIYESIIPLLEKLNPRKLIITGGEPLMNTELVSILKAIKDCLPNIYITLQSNGFLIEKYDKIAELSKEINHIEISSSHYKNLLQLEKIINILKIHKVDVVLSYTTDGDISEIKKILDFVVAMRIGFMLNFIAPLGGAVDNDLKILDFEERIAIFKQIAEYILGKKYFGYRFLDLFRQQIRIRTSCNALGKMIAIQPDGTCHICHSLCDKKFMIGNCKTDSIDTLLNNWNKKISEKEIIEMMDVDSKEPCKTCKLRYLCGGTCAAYMNNHKLKIELCKLQHFLIAYNLLIDNMEASEEENLFAFVSLCDEKDKVLNL